MRGVFAPAFGVILLSGCGPEEASEIDAVAAHRCTALDATPAETPAEAELGVLSGERFVPLADGDSVVLYRGHQGGFMITPAVRIPAGGVAGDSICTTVHLINRAVDEDVAVTPGLRIQVRLARKGMHFESGYFDNLLAYEEEGLLGRELDVRAIVDPEGMNARVDRRVVLVPEP